MKTLYSTVRFGQLRDALRMKPLSSQSFHMRFVGNPGTGKTVVARTVGKLLAALKAIEPPKGKKVPDKMIEVSRSELVAEYVGQTADKVIKAVESALGGVLFVDEAYSLVQKEDDSFGHEAVDTLIKEMEDKRKNVIVIFAGYEKEMETFFDANPGFKSRVPFTFHFDDYTCPQLSQIGRLLLDSMGGFVMPQEANQDYDNAVSFSTGCCDALETCTESRSKGNGRAVRNTVEAGLRTMAGRLMANPPAPEATDQERVAMYESMQAGDWSDVTAELIKGRMQAQCGSHGELQRVGQVVSARMDQIFMGGDLSSKLEGQIGVVRQVSEDTGKLVAPDGTIKVAGLDETSKGYGLQCQSMLQYLSQVIEVKVKWLCVDEESGVFNQQIERLQNAEDEVGSRNNLHLLQSTIRNQEFLLDLLDAVHAGEESPPPSLPKLQTLCKDKVAEVKNTKFQNIMYGLLA